MDGTVSLLVTDGHRTRATKAVTDAYTDGRLTHDEWQMRIAAIAAARTRTDLLTTMDGLGVSPSGVFDSGFMYDEIFDRWLREAEEVLGNRLNRFPWTTVWFYIAAIVAGAALVIAMESSPEDYGDPFTMLRWTLVLWGLLFTTSLFVLFRESWRNSTLTSELTELLRFVVQRMHR